ncbi:MAG: hypothetical protein LC667_07270 [Thioalkalivibrio sp.]|nr:hypothetical protein [Thioalkalivibrio sp.]
MNGRASLNMPPSPSLTWRRELHLLETQTSSALRESSARVHGSTHDTAIGDLIIDCPPEAAEELACIRSTDGLIATKERIDAELLEIHDVNADGAWEEIPGADGTLVRTFTLDHSRNSEWIVIHDVIIAETDDREPESTVYVLRSGLYSLRDDEWLWRTPLYPSEDD